ncbi:hypothetical protein SHKM778_96220 (plasmid) [Streptomyces sp. KM77-8]|uniref:FAD-binding domain-containing protein n=1 Tax=Streptomyces haneummycinicus TaxID=3074435 RepID=A0AAT9I0Q1_9ACTN
MTTADNGGGAPPNPPQVLVAGAGPVGLTAAVELARRGLRVRLVDAASGPAVTSRAMATHARSLETYDQQGLIDDLMSRGRRIQRFTMHAGGRTLARLGPDYSRVPTRYPMTLMIDQAATEEVLRQAAAKLGVKVEWGVRLEGFTQDADAVHTVLRTADGEEHLTVERLVGCDGGHSTVRKLLGLPLLGDSSETWLIADAELEAGLPQNSIHWIKAGRGTVMAIPFPEENKWRLLDTADASYGGDPDQVAERFARKLRAGLGRPVKVSTPSWVSVFTIQQRMITSMSEGRVVLAGDAAHVHSPASGQGLNTGVQDAYNLAWKLALVVQGHAPQTLLDSYSAERVPIGRALLGSTRKATRLVQLKNSLAGVALPLVFALVRRCGPCGAGSSGRSSAPCRRWPCTTRTAPDPPRPPSPGRHRAAGRHPPHPGHRAGRPRHRLERPAGGAARHPVQPARGGRRRRGRAYRRPGGHSARGLALRAGVHRRGRYLGHRRHTRSSPAARPGRRRAPAPGLRPRRLAARPAGRLPLRARLRPHPGGPSPRLDAVRGLRSARSGA